MNTAHSEECAISTKNVNRQRRNLETFYSAKKFENLLVLHRSVVSRYMDRFGTLKPRNLVTLQPWINIIQNLGNHCNLWNFATFRISLRMTEWCCPAQPRNFRNLATLSKKYFSEFTKIIVTFVTLQLLVFLRNY